jgi:hypothetical protein
LVPHCSAYFKIPFTGTSPYYEDCLLIHFKSEETSHIADIRRDYQRLSSAYDAAEVVNRFQLGHDGSEERMLFYPRQHPSPRPNNDEAARSVIVAVVDGERPRKVLIMRLPKGDFINARDAAFMEQPQARANTSSRKFYEYLLHSYKGNRRMDDRRVDKVNDVRLRTGLGKIQRSYLANRLTRCFEQLS